MSKKLTEEYLKAHLTENESHFKEAGRLLSNAIMEDAIAYVKENGPSEKILLSPKIELEANEIKGCTTVTYTRADGSTLTYHRPT